jgi:hypothetical protein
VEDVTGNLGTQQDETNLRPVAMGYYHPPALLDHVGDVRTGLISGSKLVGHTLVIFVLDEGVPSNRYHGGLGHKKPPCVLA